MNKALLLLGILLVSTIVSAEDYVIANSAHGIDVISAISYANSADMPFDFLTSTQTATALARMGSDKEVLIIKSTTNPYTQSLKNDIEKKGSTTTTIESENPFETNLLLAQRSPAKRFVLIDTTYGYNALSAIPYAAITDAYIIFVDSDNAEAVASTLRAKRPAAVMQYGYLDEGAVDELSGMISQTIDTGDKYLDNIAIVEQYLREKDTNQAVLMDGTFIEYGVAKGEDPILLMSSAVPDSVYEYILDSDLKTLVLVGGDMVPAVDNMRQRLKQNGKEISVFVKFGQTTPGIDSSVRSLDVFNLPAYPLDLDIAGVNYNTATGLLEVTYENNVDAVAYVMADVFIEANGANIATLGDSEPLMVGKGAQRGRQYELDLSQFDLDDTDVHARVNAKYGSTKGSMEKVVAGRFLITTVTYVDESELAATKLFYDGGQKQLTLTVRNAGEVDAFFIPSLDLETKSGTLELSLDTQSLSAGKTKNVVFTGVELAGDELAMNEEVNVLLEYGAREEFLTKTFEEELELSSSGGSGGDMTWLIILILIVVAVAVFVFLNRKKRDSGKKKKWAL